MTAHSGAAPVVGQTQFPIWKTIKLGTEKTPDEYRKALEEAGYRIGDWANDILNKVVVSAQVSEVDLVNISVGELGFAEGAQYQDTAPVRWKWARNSAPPKSVPLCV
jgi:hypothetical protein